MRRENNRWLGWNRITQNMSHFRWKIKWWLEHLDALRTMGETTLYLHMGPRSTVRCLREPVFTTNIKLFLVRFQTTFSHKLGTSCLYIVSSRTEANFVSNSTKSSGIFFELFLTVSLSRRGSSKDWWICTKYRIFSWRATQSVKLHYFRTWSHCWQRECYKSMIILWRICWFENNMQVS